jgi:hypothetical protein
MRGVTMVTAKPIQVQVTTDHDAMAAIEAVQADGIPREIRRGGEIVAIVSPPEAGLEWNPSKEDIEAALSAAGSWKDFPELADLAERIHKWREESPPSEPVTW